MSQIISENMLALEVGTAVRAATGDRLRLAKLVGGQMVHMALTNDPNIPGKPMTVKMLRDDG